MTKGAGIIKGCRRRSSARLEAFRRGDLRNLRRFRKAVRTMHWLDDRQIAEPSRRTKWTRAWDGFIASDRDQIS